VAVPTPKRADTLDESPRESLPATDQATTTGGTMVTAPKTTWVQPAPPAGEYKYVPKPATAKHNKGETKYDKNFDYMLLNDVAIVVPSDEVSAVKKAYQRYARNKAIVGEYSFRQSLMHNTKSHTVWLDKKEAEE
jgi:hypothetical protein